MEADVPAWHVRRPSWSGSETGASRFDELVKLFSRTAFLLGRSDPRRAGRTASWSCGTAAEYRNHSNRPRPPPSLRDLVAAGMTSPARSR